MYRLYRCFTIVLVCFCSAIHAQEGKLTLKKVLLKAQSNTTDMIMIQKKLEADIYEIKSIKSAVWPQVQLSSSGTYISQLSFFGGGGSQPNFTGATGSPTRMGGTQYTWKAQLQQPLITFGRLGVLIKIANKSEKAAQLNFDLKKEEYFLTVIQGYNQLLLMESLISSISRQLTQLRTVESRVQLEYESGVLSKSQYLALKSQVKRMESDSLKARANYNSSLARLNNLVEAEYQSPNTPGLDEIQSSFLENSQQLSPKKKKELMLGELNSQINSHWVKYERANLLPAISLFGNVSSTIFEFSIPNNPDFSQGDWADLVNPTSFDYQIGLALNWTLFDGFATTSKAKQKRAEAVIAERQWSKLKKEIEVSQKESLELLKSTEQVLKSSSEAFEAVQLTKDQAELDYKEGALSLSEYLEIQSQYAETERMIVSALTERITALANYRLAYGISLAEGIQ